MADTPETTEPRKRPWRKRRGWLILGFLIVVSFFFWWHWPRGDARFVGKWRLESDGRPANLGDLTWELAANGSGRTIVKRAERTYHLRYSWRFKDDRLIFGWNPPSWTIGGLRSLQNICLKTGGAVFLFGEEAYAVSMLTGDELRLRDVADPTTELRLRRVPD